MNEPYQQSERYRPLIDRGTARLEKLPESALAERVLKLAATTGQWRVNRVNDTWVLLDENGLVDFEDSSLGQRGVPTRDVFKERPETVIKRYYGNLFDSDEIGNGADFQP